MGKTNPTVNHANRAFVRLHTYVTKNQGWGRFNESYQVVPSSNGSEDAILFIVQVFDTLGQPAALGAKIPNQITVSCRKDPAMSVWTEFFNDGKLSWRNVIRR